MTALAELLKELSAQANLGGAGLYVANAGEYLKLASWPPKDYRDFGPGEFMASAHYLLAPALAKYIKDCPVALTYSDETRGFVHALERAALDIKRGRIQTAVVLGAVLSYPLESDVGEDMQTGAAVFSGDAAELSGLAKKFGKDNSRIQVAAEMMKSLAVSSK